MVSGAELAVLGTIGGSIAGGGFGLWQFWLRENHQNNRKFSELIFEKKFEVITELHSQYNKTGQELIKHTNVRDILNDDFQPSTPEFNAVLAEYEKLADKWAKASLLINDENEAPIRRGGNLFYKILNNVSREQNLKSPINVIPYNDDYEFDSVEDFYRITDSATSAMRQEIHDPVSELK